VPFKSIISCVCKGHARHFFSLTCPSRLAFYDTDLVGAGAGRDLRTEHVVEERADLARAKEVQCDECDEWVSHDWPEKHG
jgi:hypothetical protein